MLDKLYIFDLDGTIANIEHRRHFVTGEKKDWDSFNSACADDTENDDVVSLLHSLSYCEFRIIIFSGRSQQVKTLTERWLRNAHIWYEHLEMRKENDFTPDEELKRGWLNEYIADGTFKKSDIFGVFDDRQKVVDMWRSEGLTCFQVAPGNF